MKRQLQLGLGGLFFALLFINAGVFFYRNLQVLGMRSDPGWAPDRVGNHIIISQVKGGGPAFPLQRYDEVLSVNGQPLTDASDFIAVFEDFEPGTVYSITIKRLGQVKEFKLQTQAIPLSVWSVNVAASLIVPEIFLLTGFVVFLLKPYDKLALLLSLMFGMFIGVIISEPPLLAGQQWWLAGVMFTVGIISLFLWPIFFHFFLIFPEPSPLARRFPKLEFYLYLPHLLTIFPYLSTVKFLWAFSPEQVFAFDSSFSLLKLVSFILMVLYIAGGLLLLLTNYRQASRASRRKMRVVVVGSIAGFMPLFVVIGLAFLFDLPGTNPTLLRWLSFIAFFSFPLFPLSFAYAIVRHQVIPIRLIVRRGVRYLLVSRGFIIIQAVVVFALLSYLLTGSRMETIDRMGERADIAVTLLATAVAIGLLTLVNQRVMPIIDRRFFREAYDAQQVLSDLGQAMRTVTTIPQLLELAVAKTQDALHTENVTIFLRDNASGDYVCAISSRSAEDGDITTDSDRSLILPRNSYVVERMSHSPTPLVVDHEKLTLWAHLPASADAAINRARQKERATLGRMRSTLLLPIATKDELLGIVSLGPRLGDLPFSREDKQLLMAVTWQMAFAIQNAQLVQQITEEERLRHELEIATTVQQRLFPEKPPEVGRLELSGVCHPARGVGGDYYDFILLGVGRVGIAVADVAGKGISAALLMSTVQASLRSQAPSVNGKLTELVSSMNRLLHLSTDSHSYASFFYAQFDEETRLLTYVNAGHNPPILVRTASAIKAQGAAQGLVGALDGGAVAADLQAESNYPGISLLTTGGPVIGAFDSCDYEQETIEMNGGDLLVAYTDGVTEALNSNEEEYTEQRLRSLIARSIHLSAQELIERIVESVRNWCGDRPQHDDLTLVVMKVK